MSAQSGSNVTKGGISTIFCLDGRERVFDGFSQTVLDLIWGKLYLCAVAWAICIVCGFLVSAHQFLEAKRVWRRKICPGRGLHCV